VKEAFVETKDRTNTLIVLVCALGLTAFIAILVAVSRPEASDHSSTEILAISTLRTMASAQSIFADRYDRFATLGELANAQLIDQNLAKAVSPETARSGYCYKLTAKGDMWSVLAMPAEPGVSGTRSFYIDGTGILREAPCMSTTDVPATVASSVLEMLEK
jgi:hypothetical protein